MVKGNINITVNNWLCSGCGACNAICPKDAITYHFDEIGQLLPQIDNEKCINCGLCHNVCPSIDNSSLIKDFEVNSIDFFVGNNIKTRLVKSNDEDIYKNSQSGGAVTSVLKYLLDNKLIDAAVVCEVIFAQEYTSKGVIITDSKDLIRCQKSSYVPVDMLTALKQTSSYKSIAIVGTGCVIQGVKQLQRQHKKFNNINYLLGLICDRTLTKTVSDILYADKYPNANKKIVWRDKAQSYKNPILKIVTEQGEELTQPSWKRHALKEHFTTPRCRICFDKLNVFSDIVFGDPWGMSDVDWQNGMSVVVSRTDKGESLLQNMIQDSVMDSKDADINELISGQAITKKKENVDKAIMAFKSLGLALPSYCQNVETVNSDYTSIKNSIEKFRSLSKRSKNTIVSLYRFKLWKISLINKLYKLKQVLLK